METKSCLSAKTFLLEKIAIIFLAKMFPLSFTVNYGKWWTAKTIRSPFDNVEKCGIALFYKWKEKHEK